MEYNNRRRSRHTVRPQNLAHTSSEIPAAHSATALNTVLLPTKNNRVGVEKHTLMRFPASVIYSRWPERPLFVTRRTAEWQANLAQLPNFFPKINNSACFCNISRVNYRHCWRTTCIVVAPFFFLYRLGAQKCSAWRTQLIK